MSNRNVGTEIAVLPRMEIKDLRSRYAEVFGEPTKSGNKHWLAKRIAWRLQSMAEGDLSERARERAAELARDLAPDIQEAILFLLPVRDGRDPIILADLQPIALTADWRKQRKMFQSLRPHSA